MRRAIVPGLAMMACLLAIAACKNTLNYLPPGVGCGAPGSICTAGDGTGVGDGGPALDASLAYPESVSIDAAGNIYVADYAQNRVRKIDAVTGVISTLAGTGRKNFGVQEGLPGVGTLAPQPQSVAVAPDGWVFWMDGSSCTIYGVDPADGYVERVSGGGCNYDQGGPLLRDATYDFDGCSGITADGLGNIVVADSDRYRVRYLNRGSAPAVIAGITVPPGEVRIVAGNSDCCPTGGLGDGGLATNANVIPCHAVAAADGSLVISDTGYNRSRIRYVNPAGTISTIVGTGINGGGGDGGPATAATIAYPEGLVLDEAAGLVFFSDENNRVRVVNRSGQPVVWGGVTVGTGRIMTIAGQQNTDYLVVGTGSAIQQRFRFVPSNGAIDPAGNLVLADTGNHVIRKVDKATGQMTVIAGLRGNGSLPEYVQKPTGVALLPDGTLVFAANRQYLYQVDPGGELSVIAGNGDPVASGDGGPPTFGGFWANAVTVDPAGAIYVADGRNHRVRRIDPTGVIGSLAGDGGGSSGGDGGPAVNASFDGPHGLVLDSSGNLYVADNDRIRFINRSISALTVAGVLVAPGSIETIAGGNDYGFTGDGGPALAANLSLQYYDDSDDVNGMALLGQYLYFSDSQNNRIRRLDLASGIIETQLGTGPGGFDGIGNPQGLAIHGGYLYWVQRSGNVVRRQRLPDGIIETIAGDGGLGYYGDGGPARDAQLIEPQGLVISPDGVLFVSDGSHRVRQIRP